MATSGISAVMGRSADSQMHDASITQLRVIIIVFEIFSITAVALRFIARRLSHSSFWADDWLALLAGILSVVNMANDLVIVHFGAGRKMAEVQPQDIGPFFLYIYIGQTLYAPIIVSIKMAVLSLYLRLFSPNLTTRRVVYAFMVLTLVWGVATFIPTLFQCIPTAGAWDRSIPSRCINIGDFLLGTNVPDVILDIGILLIPLPIIWRLQIPTSKKIAIICIFLLATFDTAMAIVRLASLTNFNDSDLTLGFTQPLIWSTIEINVGIVCACLPVMTPIFHKLFGGCVGSWSSRGGSSPDRRSPDAPAKGYGASKLGNRISVISVSAPNRFHRLQDTEKGTIEMTTQITIVHEDA